MGALVTGGGMKKGYSTCSWIMAALTYPQFVCRHRVPMLVDSDSVLLHIEGCWLFLPFRHWGGPSSGRNSPAKELALQQISKIVP